MFHLNDAFFKEEMPARAKRLFVKTFAKYHKLDGGDEEIALHLAHKAVEREYVKLNDRWIPKSAAEEIVRHDIDNEDSLSEKEDLSESRYQRKRQKRFNYVKPNKIKISNEAEPTTTNDSINSHRVRLKSESSDTTSSNNEDDDDDDGDDDSFDDESIDEADDNYLYSNKLLTK